MKYRYINKKTFIKISILFLLIIGIVSFLIGKTDSSNINKNVWVILLSICIISITAMGILGEAKTRSYSFSLMFWMFNFLFMGISPLIQYLSNWRAWRLSVSDEKYIECQILILIWLVCFHFGKSIINRYKFSNLNNPVAIEIIDVRKTLALVIQIFIVVYLITLLGDKLFFKGAESGYSFSSSTLYLLNHHFFRNMVYFITILQVIAYKIRKKQFLIVLSSIILLLVGCFPLGISRYMVGSFYLGLMIICLSKEKLKGWFPFIFLFALMIVFPISNMFRFSTSLPTWNLFIQNATKLMQGTYNTGNYDAFHMFAAATDYVNLEGYSYGYQMLGALFFFIPRSIWHTKPVGSGEMVIVGLKNAEFSNVSMPLVGEAYINFGIIGIIFFSLIIGIVCEIFDKKYWDNNGINTLYILYPSAVLYFFFFNRGDMLSTGSYMIANIVVGIIAIEIFTKRKVTIKNNE